MKVRAGLVSAAAVCAPLVVAEEQEAAKELVCINDETQWRTGYNFRRKPQSFAIVWRKLVTKLLLNSDPSQFSSNDVAESAVSTSRHRVAKSTMSTCLSTGNAGCMVLEVHHPSASACAVADSVYELFEPVHLELGEKVQHVVDYAYSPVANTALVRESIHVHTSNSNAETHLQEDSSVGIEESARGGWWQWWIPWKMLRERNKSAYGSKYSIHEEAFAGGSHGEVWRGRRKCNKKDKGCHDDPLIFKRLKIETGFRTLEAGLREVYFGNLLQQGPQRVFTQYVEHFFGEAGELWIVFRDAGPSLRSLLYTGTDTGDFVVYQSSWLWTLIRKSLLAKQNDVIEKTDEHPVVALLDAKEDARGYQQEDGRIGRQLISTFLRQVRYIYEGLVGKQASLTISAACHYTRFWKLQKRFTKMALFTGTLSQQM